MKLMRVPLFMVILCLTGMIISPDLNLQKYWVNSIEETERSWPKSADIPTITPIGNYVVDSWALAGNFRAAYTFDTDVPGSKPKNFSVLGIDTSCTVLEIYDNHSQVMQISDPLDEDYCDVRLPFMEGITAGTVECYVAVGSGGDANDYLQIALWDTEYFAAWLALGDGKLKVWKGVENGGYEDLVTGVQVGRFYHLRVEFNCNTKNFSVWWNGTAAGGPRPFLNATIPGGVTGLRFWVVDDDSILNGYVDAVDLSWYPRYAFGRNFPHFEWNITYPDPNFELTYNITRNDTQWANGTGIKSGDSIVVWVGNLSVGDARFWINVTNGTDWSVNEVIVYRNYNPDLSATTNLLEYSHGSTGQFISWTIFDRNASNPLYNLYKNNTIWGTTNQVWTSGEGITLGVDGLGYGDHNFTLVATDGYGGCNASEILVRVWDNHTNGTWQTVNYGRSWINCTRWGFVYAELNLKVVMPPVQVQVTVYLPGAFPKDFTGGVLYFKIAIDGDSSSAYFPMPGRFHYDPTILGADIEEENLEMYYWSEVGGKWTLMEGFVNGVENYIYVDYIGAGDYIIVARPATVDIVFLVEIFGAMGGVGLVMAMLWSRRLTLQKQWRLKTLRRVETEVKHVIGL